MCSAHSAIRSFLSFCSDVRNTIFPYSSHDFRPNREILSKQNYLAYNRTKRQIWSGVRMEQTSICASIFLSSNQWSIWSTNNMIGHTEVYKFSNEFEHHNHLASDPSYEIKQHSETPCAVFDLQFYFFWVQSYVSVSMCPNCSLLMSCMCNVSNS